jgi:hypothetical protein
MMCFIVIFKILANDWGLALWWYAMIRQPGAAAID